MFSLESWANWTRICWSYESSVCWFHSSSTTFPTTTNTTTSSTSTYPACPYRTSWDFCPTNGKRTRRKSKLSNKCMLDVCLLDL